MMINRILICFLILMFFGPYTYSQSLQTKLINAIESQGFSGSILVANGSDILLKTSNGFADKINKSRISSDTKFGLASLGKLFTQIAILQLADSNKISLTDSIGLYLDFLDDEVLKKATINDLLFHKSGLGHYWENKLFKERVNFIDSLHEFKPIIQSLKREFTPGSEYRYSNAGYILLGLIIEKVSDQDYYSYVSNYITQPLGMNSTSFTYESNLGSTYAKPYTLQKEEITKTPRGSADGGNYSSINDLEKLFKALFIDKVLISQQLVNFLIANSPISLPNTYELTGGFPGNSTAALFDKKTGYWMIALSNTDPPSATTLIRSYIEIILTDSAPSQLKLIGLVSDSSSHQPIPYVNIGIMEKGLGTASNEAGEYKLTIPKSFFGDSLTFSAIGYKVKKYPLSKILNNDTLKVYLTEYKKQLDEVIVEGQKMMSTKEGVTTKTPFYSGAYIGGGQPGATLLTLLELPKSPSYLYYAKVHVTGNKKEKPFKLRLRILKMKNDGTPGNDILNENIIVESSIESGWVKFELNSPLSLDENVFVGVEWIEEPDNTVNRRTAYPRISVISSKNSRTYNRRTSLGKWDSIPLKVALHAYVEF